VQALKSLMEQHGLKQSDLSEIGSQGVVSEILTGKRELNIRQVRALSARFGVAAATFFETNTAGAGSEGGPLRTLDPGQGRVTLNASDGSSCRRRPGWCPWPRRYR
jgi:transcriptional regulator with XRE-family HTH domain